MIDSNRKEPSAISGGVPVRKRQRAASIRCARRAWQRHAAGYERKASVGPTGGDSGLQRPASGDFDPADQSRPVRSEQALWRAVILQALTDAASESRKYETRLEREKARRWLLAAGEDFVTVCHHAGYDPSYLHRHVRRALAGGCQWRIKPNAHSRATNHR